MLNWLKNTLGGGPSTDFKELVKEGSPIIDVRTPSEFRSGHIDGAINIPLDTLSRNMDKLKEMKQPIITCCLSGGRSGAAATKMKNAGIEAVNGGGWMSLQGKLVE
ncbi:MAG: rhodanese-like domain-containing protein [Bacteroidota bacterium]